MVLLGSLLRVGIPSWVVPLIMPRVYVPSKAAKSITLAIAKLEGIKQTLKTEQTKKEIVRVCRILKEALEEL